jgi:methoxymalonate biosynthesis acyl carrier protein
VTTSLTGESVRTSLIGFLEQRTRRSWAADEDLFASGVVSSLFAMELVVYVESTFGIGIGGADLTIANFRTVDLMTDLVLRLRDE